MRCKEVIIVLAIASFLPVWRSGGRENLTFWGWVINHTIFGPPIEYVPLEQYEEELKGCKLICRK